MNPNIDFDKIYQDTLDEFKEQYPNWRIDENHQARVLVVELSANVCRSMLEKFYDQLLSK